MFIENALDPITRAPAERNDSHIDRETDVCFAPLERGGSLGGRTFYKHLAPLGRNEVNCVPVPGSLFPVHCSLFWNEG
jgi:hypothetical protein